VTQHAGTPPPYVIGRSFARLSRPAAFVVVTAAYVLAGGVAVAVGHALLRHHHPITTTFVADLVATAVVFALSMVLANASLYDPYWSVAPPLVALFWLSEAPSGLPTSVQVRQVLVIALVAAWAVRLTGNWAIGWHGLGQEDWRYGHLRTTTHGRLPYWLVNLVGIQLVPTLVVFAGLLPLWPALGAPTCAFNALDVVAAIVTAAAIVIEFVADNQMRAFTRNPTTAGARSTSGCGRGRATPTTSVRSASGGGYACSVSRPPRPGGGPSSGRS